MKPFLIALLLIGASLVRGADAPALTFYVQLIQGSDQDSPPSPQARLIGPKLDRRLHDVFKWKNYWEIKRATVSVKTGDKTRTRISKEREVEIALTGPQNMQVSIYANGKLTRKRQQSIDAAFYIAGGDNNDAAQSWFIVVRRDNPDAASDSSKLVAVP